MHIGTGDAGARGEDLTQGTIPMRMFARRPSTMSSRIPVGFPQNSIVGQQRQQVSELHCDKFRTSSAFLNWQIRFKNQVDGATHFRGLPSRTEGRGSWRNIRGTCITTEEAKQLVSKTMARLKQDDLNMLDWELTDSDQGIFDTKMMMFLWFQEGVTPVMRMVLNDIQRGLTGDPLPFEGVNVRATLELDPVKRPWNKTQAIFIGVMKEYANLPLEAFDVRWVDTGLRVSVAAPLWRTALPIALASFTFGANWALNFEKCREFAPQVGSEVVQTLLLDA